MDLAKYPLDQQECMLHLESCECRAGRGLCVVGHAGLPGASVWEGRGSGRQGPVQLAWLRASTERGAGQEEKGLEGLSSLAGLPRASALPTWALEP